jgi:hypothetical protein
MEKIMPTQRHRERERERERERFYFSKNALPFACG